MKKDWIKRLPPGEYTMKQIKEFAGLNAGNSAKLVLLKYGAKVKSIRLYDTNILQDLFIWKGYKPKPKDKKKDKNKSQKGDYDD